MGRHFLFECSRGNGLLAPRGHVTQPPLIGQHCANKLQKWKEHLNISKSANFWLKIWMREEIAVIFDMCNEAFFKICMQCSEKRVDWMSPGAY